VSRLILAPVRALQGAETAVRHKISLTWCVAIAMLLSALVFSAPVFSAEDPNGGWAEIEDGAQKVDMHIGKWSIVSGGKAADSWSAGKGMSAELCLPEDLADAAVFVRYARFEKSDVKMALALTPITATDATARPLPELVLKTTANWDDFQWAKIRLGKVAAGVYNLSMEMKSGEIGGLKADIIGIDRWQDGKWNPPNEVRDGKFYQDGRVWTPPNLSGAGVVVEAPVGPYLGLLQSTDYLGPHAKPVTYVVKIRNSEPRNQAEVTINGMVLGEMGPIAEIPARKIVIAPGKAESVEISFSAPGFGWYAVRLQAKDAKGQELTSLNTSFCVIHPAAEGLRPDSIFGINTGNSPEDLDICRQIGVKWRRTAPGTHPFTVSPEKGKWWSESDIASARKAIIAWKAAGVLCLGLVDYCPPWNVRKDAAGNPIPTYKSAPADLAAHAEMVYQMIKPVRDLVTVWELWNEPEPGGHYWSGTAEDYRDMMRKVWERIKPEMPEIKIINGSYTWFVRHVVYEGKDSGYSDGSSTHPYSEPNLFTLSTTALEAALGKKFSKTGGKAGVWATEFGTLSWDGAKAEDIPFLTARSIAPFYLLGRLGAGDLPYHGFMFKMAYPGRTTENEAHLDFYYGTSPKPAVAAYSTLAHFTEDTKVLGDLFGQIKTGWAIHLQKEDGSSVVVIWPERGYEASRTLPCTLRLPEADFQAFDYLGQPVGKHENGQLVIPTCTWQATYLVSKLAAAQVKQAVLQTTFEKRDPVFINLRSFAAPLATKPALRIKVESRQLATADVRIQVTAPKGIVLATSEVVVKNLKPGETRFVELPLSQATAQPTNRYLFTYTASTGGAKQQIEQEGKQEVQVACAVFGTPKIDGDLSDWADAVPVSITHPHFLNGWGGRKPPMTEGDGYRLWTKWDQRFFYAAAEWLSSTPNPGNQLELAFDGPQKNPANLLADHPLYDKCLLYDKDNVFTVSENSAPPEGGSTIMRYDAALKLYRVEIAVPWERMPEVASRITEIKAGGSVLTRFAWLIMDRGDGWPRPTHWQQEAGDATYASQGKGVPMFPGWADFSVSTDWGFYRPVAGPPQSPAAGSSR